MSALRAVSDAAVQMMLSTQQLQQVSACATHSAQAQWLNRWGIEFTESAGGTLFVTDEQVDAALFRQVVPGIVAGEETSADVRAYEDLRNRKLVTYSARPDPRPRRTPGWADLKAIARMYVEARRLTDESGVRHSVDHVIPLCGSKVTGLHVETNLQIITLEENIRKSNRWSP